MADEATATLTPPAPEAAAVATPQPSTPETPATPQPGTPPATPPPTPSPKLTPPPPETPAKPEDAVPETYKVPTVEGVQFDESALKEFQAFAKESGLSQKAFEKFVEFDAKMAQRAEEATKTAIEERKAAQVKEIDKVFGASKTKALEQAARFMDTFGSKLNVRDYLAKSGLDTDPVLTQLFALAGSAISEDTHVNGQGAVPEKRTADILYPNSK